MGNVHVEPIENDFRVFVLAIKLIASAHFNGVHACGSDDPLVVNQKNSTFERPLLEFLNTVDL